MGRITRVLPSPCSQKCAHMAYVGVSVCVPLCKKCMSCSTYGLQRLQRETSALPYSLPITHLMRLCLQVCPFMSSNRGCGAWDSGPGHARVAHELPLGS